MESSKSDSRRVESTYELVLPAKPKGLRWKGGRRSRSLSLSDLRRKGCSKALGVPIGVLSAVELRSCSLVTGEKCSGGGVSLGSRFTTQWGYWGKNSKYDRGKGAECGISRWIGLSQLLTGHAGRAVGVSQCVKGRRKSPVRSTG